MASTFGYHTINVLASFKFPSGCMLFLQSQLLEFLNLEGRSYLWHKIYYSSHIEV